MLAIPEQGRVEETRDLEPIKEVLAQALFGEDALWVNWQKAHRSRDSHETKYPDGLVWFPAAGELWLVEIEWKRGSNFFPQLEAFVGGAIDESKLTAALSDSLRRARQVLAPIRWVDEELALVSRIISSFAVRRPARMV